MSRVRRTGSVRLALLLLVLVGLPVRSTRADPEELQRRLKAASVEASLREKVLPATDRAVRFILERQATDGHFAERHPQGEKISPTTVTLTVALALRHVGTPATEAPVAKALVWLFDQDLSRVEAIKSRAIDAGLALMLIASTGGREALGKELVAALVASLDDSTGWWKGNVNSAVTYDPMNAPAAAGEDANLEASQFAVLGLLAARRMKVEVPRAVWARHAQSLVEQQTEKYHSWPVNAADRAGNGKTIGTLLGLGNLVAAAQVLKAAGGAGADVDAAIKRSRGELGRDGGRTLSNPRGHFEMFGDEEGLQSSQGIPPFRVNAKQAGRQIPAHPGAGPFSRLFAAEHAFRLAEIETIDTFAEGKPVFTKERPKTTRTPCYATAATWLLAAQREDGGWSPDSDGAASAASELDTAYALLVLTRAVSAFHPIRPAPIDAKPRPAAKPANAPAPPSKKPGDPAPAMGG